MCQLAHVAAGWTDPTKRHAFSTSHGFVSAADYNRHPTPDKENGRQRAADALVAALPRFSPQALLLFDDTDSPRRAKGELVSIP